ncbi:MAG TPA: hypothetical protein ENI27_07445 [bacterium]|nr:hypothetical protein [bacterium]
MNMPLEEVLKLETRLPLHLVEISPGLEEDIRQNGIREPIEIRIREDGSMIVWDGLHRLSIAKKIGLEYVPVILVPMY